MIFQIAKHKPEPAVIDGIRGQVIVPEAACVEAEKVSQGVNPEPSKCRRAVDARFLVQTARRAGYAAGLVTVAGAYDGDRLAAGVSAGT